MGTIKASDIFKIEKLTDYKLHLATNNGDENPLDVFLRSRDEWKGWNEWKGEKNDFTRQYVFSVIKIYNEPDKWLFGGVFKIEERLENGYKIALQDDTKELIGRLVVDFHRYQGLLGRAFNLENHFDNFVVSEIRKTVYDSVRVK